jgi:putative oxidoreductase
LITWVIKEAIVMLHRPFPRAPRRRNSMRDLALLILRVVTGGLLAGHGSQKLFGAFEGPGLQGTRQMMTGLGLRPDDKWALAAGGSEFAGGTLTALGFLHPLGPIIAMAPMATAIRTVHWGKPIWATKGGAELPLTNLAVISALALAGPGRLSLDSLIGIKAPPALSILAAIGTGAGLTYVAYASGRRPQKAEEEGGQPQVPEDPGQQPQERQSSRPGASL